MALAEVADRSEVRRIERDNHHEIVPLAAGSSNAPRRIQPACIAMQQKRNHHARIERRLAQPTHIAAHDRLEIQALPHQPNDKPRDVVLGHKVPHIRRQKQRLIDIPRAKVLAHSPSLNQTRWDLNSDYSDMLLGVSSGAAMFLLFATLVGSIFNIPVAELPPERTVSHEVIHFFGMRYRVPVVTHWAGTVIAVNVGGAVIPTLMSVYLL